MFNFRKNSSVQDTELEYDDRIAKNDQFHLTAIFAIITAAIAFYSALKDTINHSSMPIALGIVLSLLTIVSLIWWKKVEALACRKDAHLSYLMQMDKNFRIYYTNQTRFLEAHRKRKKYHSVQSSSYYSLMLAQIMCRLFMVATVSVFLFALIENIIALFV